MKKRPTVLFLCTGNSCRSQRAEGWARALHGDLLDVHSAGLETHGLNPRAVRGLRSDLAARDPGVRCRMGG